MSPLDTWGRIFQAEGTESAKALQTEQDDPGKLLHILHEGAACALESARLWFKAWPQSCVQQQLLSHSMPPLSSIWNEIKTMWELNELIFIKHSEQSLAHGESSSVNCCCDYHFLCNIFILTMTVSLDACPLSHELFLVMSVSSLYLQHPTQGQHTGGPQNVRWGT